MMVLEERQDDAQSIRCLVITKDSEPVGWLRGHTRIGPVHQIRVICCLDQFGIGIQVVQSTSRNGSYSWIVTPRGPTKMTLLKHIKVAKSARCCPPGLSRCCATHSGFL